MLVPLTPKPGINSDDTTFGAEGNWADGNNTRFDLATGRPAAVSRSVSKLTLPQTGDECCSVLVFERGGVFTIAYGHKSYLYVGTGFAAPSNVTPSPSTGWLGVGAAGCCFVLWGATTLLASKIGVPGSGGSSGPLFEQTSGAATEVTAAPDKITYFIVTDERQVLALGCNEEVSGTFNSRCIRGSDLEDYTDWTTTSTNNAFEHTLEGDSPIVAGAKVGPYVAVWTYAALWLGQFLGDPAQTYRFEKVGDNCGLAGALAFAVVDGVAYWVDPALNVRRWSPGAPVEVIPCPIWADFAKNLTTSGTTALAHLVLGANTARREIWISYVDTRDATGENSRYIAFNYERGWWFRGIDTIQAWCGNAAAQRLIGDLGAVVAVKSGNVVYSHDQEGTGCATGYIQSADFYLDESQRRALVRTFIPDFEEQVASVDLTLFVRDRPRSSATTRGPYAIATSATKKDFRASGKILAAKLSWSQTSGTTGIEIGKPLFDVVPLGER